MRAHGRGRWAMQGVKMPRAIVLAAALVGGAVAIVPAAAVGVAGGLGLGALLWLAHRHPTRVAPWWVFLLLLAGTKFRVRDASDSLAGVLDGQVLLELALYGVLAAVLAVVAHAAHAAQVRVLPLRRMELVTASWVGLLLVSLLWSDAPALSAVRASEVALHAAAAVVFTRLRTPAQLLRDVGRPLTLYVLGCAGLAAAVPAASGMQVNSYEGVDRFSWFAVHPISAATMATMAAVLVGVPLLARGVPVGVPGRVMRRVLAAAAVAGLLGVAAATHSRGPLVAALAALVLAFLAVRVSWTGIVALAAGGAAAVMLVASSGLEVRRTVTEYASHGGWVSRLVFRGQTAEQVAEFSGRAELWTHVVRLIAERPVLGRGYQGSRAELLRVVPWAGHAHNALLQAVLDTGVVGAGLLVVLLVNTAHVGSLRGRLPTNLRVARATLLAVAAYQALNAISSESFSGNPGLETFLLLVCACLAERVRVAPVARTPARPAPRPADRAPAALPGLLAPARATAALGAPLRPA